jgi:raffinose/stachyose/melibiose transport system permease protein
MLRSDSNVASRVVIYILAVIWVVITIYPLIFLIQNSFKTSTEFFMGDVWTLPGRFSLATYQKVWETHFARFLANSLFVVSISLTILLLAGSSAAFGLSRIRFRLSGVLASFMGDIPASLEEAGYIDGASRFQVFWNIVLPISRPAVTAVGIYNAVILWNEFIFPLVLINSTEKRPLTLALWNFQGEFSADVPAMMAALLLSMIPLLIFYAVTKERLIEGLVAGAIKG